MEPPARDVELVTGPRAALRRLGHRLGAAAQPGDVIALVGDLGAGKTFLAQAISVGVGVGRGVRVASPTFTIVQTYPGRIPFVHADLYRLGSIDEVAEVGVFADDVAGLVVAEWADRFPEAIPAGALWLEIERVSPLRRRVRAGGVGPRVARLLAAGQAA